MTNILDTVSFKNILRIAFPLMVSGLSMTLVNLTDTLFISQLGKIELGGVGNAVLLFTVILQIGLGFSTGAQIILSRRNGQREYAAIGAVFQHSLVFMSLFACSMILLVHLSLDGFTKLVIESAEVGEVFKRYLSVRSWGILFGSINVVFMAFYVGITRTKIIGIITPISAGLNILLDYLLIFGKLGLPELGVEGAAIASNIADLSATLIYVLFTFQVYKNSNYKLFNWQGISWARYQNLLKVSSPVMIQNFIALSAWFLFFTVIEHLGEDQLAASHIIRSIYMVLIIPVFGIGDTTNTLTGNLLGEERSDQVWRLIKNANLLGLFYCLALQPILFLFGEELFLPFQATEAIIEMGLPAMYVVFSALFLFTALIVGFRVMSGAGKTMEGMIIEIITVTIYLVCAWKFAQIPNVELYVVWSVEFIYFGVFLLFVYSYLLWGNWKKSNI